MIIYRMSSHSNLKRSKKSRFAADVMKLSTGTALAQGLTILSAPVIARLYAPEEFGVSALFVSISGIISVIACMRYELSIVMPETDEEAANLLVASLLFVAFISALTFLTVWFGKQAVLNFLKAPSLSSLFWMIPITVLLNGVFLALNYWNTRTKHFGRLSFARIISSATTIGAQIGAGFAGYATSRSLIAAYVLGSFISAIALGVQIWRDDGKLLRRSIRWAGIFAGIKRHRKFPMYNAWGALLNNISWQLPVFMLSSFFSATVVGYYALCMRLIKIPMSLIGQSIGQVFLQRAAVARMEGDLNCVVENTFRQLVIFGMFPMLLLTIIGQDFFTVFLGAKWAEAGVYTQILSVWAFLWFISSPMSTLFSVIEKQESGLKIQIAIFTSRLAVLLIGGLLGNARTALVLFSLSGILVYGYLNMAIMIHAGVRWLKIRQILFNNFIFFIPVGCILSATKYLGANAYLQLTASAILFGGYMVYMIRNGFVTAEY